MSAVYVEPRRFDGLGLPGNVTVGGEFYYKVREVVRRRGHSDDEACRVFKDWHVELRVGVGHVSVWTSDGIVYLTMQEKPVYHRPGPWEEHLSRLHRGQPRERPQVDLRALLRSQLEGSPATENGSNESRC